MSRHRADKRPWARFDDLQARSAIVFPAVRQTVVARRLEEVVPCLEEVERATDAGSWAFGFVAYEAAAALDPALAVHSVPVDGLPLVWFGLTDATMSRDEGWLFLVLGRSVERVDMTARLLLDRLFPR